MLTLFRKFQKEALILLAVIIIIAFALLPNVDLNDELLGTENCVIKVGDRCYRRDEALKLASYMNLAYGLQMTDFVETLTDPGRGDGDPSTEFVMNLLVLRKQAEKMGIEPSAEEIKAAIPELPALKGSSYMDGDVVRSFLTRQGLTEGDLAQLVKDYLSFRQMKELVGAGIQAVPTASEKSYIQANQRYTASLINFDRSSYIDQADVSEEEVKKYFDDRQPKAPEIPQATPDFAETSSAGEESTEEAQPEQPQPTSGELMTAQKRGFDYVKFTPEKLAEDATQEQKAKSRVTFAKGVNQIYAQLAEPDADFAAIAAGLSDKGSQPFSIAVEKLEPFSEDEAPKEVNQDPALLRSLFSDTLNMGQVSVPASGPEGAYYIFRYSDTVEPRPMTLEEAKPLIKEVLKVKKSDQLASDAANAGLAKLQAALDAGDSILDAASANNFDLVELPNFSASEPPADRTDSGLIIGAVTGVEAGKLSAVKQQFGGRGYFIAHVDKIEIYKDNEKAIALVALEEEAKKEEKHNLFLAWLTQRAAEIGGERNNSLQNYR